MAIWVQTGSGFDSSIRSGVSSNIGQTRSRLDKLLHVWVPTGSDKEQLICLAVQLGSRTDKPPNVQIHSRSGPDSGSESDYHLFQIQHVCK